MMLGAQTKRFPGSLASASARQGLWRWSSALAAALRPTRIGFWIAVAFLAAAASMWAVGLTESAAVAGIAGAGVACGWGVTALIDRREIDEPMEKIAVSMETLAARDVMALVDEFANLAQGETPRQLEVYSTPIDLPSDPQVRRVVEALNSTIYRLQASAFQFYAASMEPCRRLFYVGADDYLLGCAAADAMGASLPDGGDVLLLAPNLKHAGVELRRRGFQSMVAERYPNIRICGVLESRIDTARMRDLVRNFIRTHPHLAGIYCTEASGADGVVDGLRGISLTGRIPVIAHDLLDATMEGLRAGLITTAISQDPFGQGHDTVIHLFNHIAHGWLPPEPRLISKSDLVTSENYHEFWRPYEGVIETPAMQERRARPLGPSARPIRIAVLGINDSAYWDPVKIGVLAAAEELAHCNATVEWIVPETVPRFIVDVRGAAVEQLVADGYEGIATPIYDPDLVPYLNRAVEQGVTVATLNAEASSLQGLVATLSKERRRLELAAGSLEVAAHHDALTGALNRLVMDADLEAAARSAAASNRPTSVIMIDIDHFKLYNDMLGHTAGDEVLRMVAQRIQREVRPEDRVYRYGGEEFLVLLKETSLEEGQSVANRIAHGVASLNLPHEQNQPWKVVTVSAGVSAIDPRDPSPADAVASADAALYRSKASGRNTVATA
jgi:diguanylate cyclase (GGDEF)-like protein